MACVRPRSHLSILESRAESFNYVYDARIRAKYWDAVAVLLFLNGTKNACDFAKIVMAKNTTPNTPGSLPKCST